MFATKLFHVSEEGDLRQFHPRQAPSITPGLSGPKIWEGDVPVVWAVDEQHLMIRMRNAQPSADCHDDR